MTEKETLRSELRLRGVDVPETWSLKQLRAKKVELDKDIAPAPATEPEGEVEAVVEPEPEAEAVVAPEPEPEAEAVVAPSECVVKPKFDFNYAGDDYVADKAVSVSPDVATDLAKKGLVNRVS